MNTGRSYLASEYTPEQIFFSLNTHTLQLLVSLCPILLLRFPVLSGFVIF